MELYQTSAKLVGCQSDLLSLLYARTSPNDIILYSSYNF